MNFPKIKYKNSYRPALMADLRKSIDAYFAEHKTSRYANRRMKIKMAAIFLLFTGSYALLLSAGHSLAAYLSGMCLFGFSSALIAFNIGHDASHGALSQKKWVNKLFSWSFNLVGVNSYIWNLKHNISHHAYTNMPGLDMDIQQVSIARLVPTMPLRKMHRYQHIYVPLLYPFASLFLVFVKDFMLFSDTQFGKKHPLREYIVLIVTKLFYFSYAGEQLL
jgi:linoleoyl-CoA desaturase